MRKLTDYEKRLGILMLRTIGCTQSETADLLKCRKEAVAHAEQGIRSCNLGEAMVYCDDQAMKRLANQEFPWLAHKEETMSPERLVRVAQLTGEDVLRHYRKDYPGKGVEHEEKRRLRALLRRWQEQLQSYYRSAHSWTSVVSGIGVLRENATLLSLKSSDKDTLEHINSTGLQPMCTWCCLWRPRLRLSI